VLPSKQQHCLVRHGLLMEACADAVGSGCVAIWAGASGLIASAHNLDCVTGFDLAAQTLHNWIAQFLMGVSCTQHAVLLGRKTIH
jgi:hypothetical protein